MKSWLIKAEGNFHLFLCDQDFPLKTSFPPKIMLSVLIIYSSAITPSNIPAVGKKPDNLMFGRHLPSVIFRSEAYAIGL